MFSQKLYHRKFEDILQSLSRKTIIDKLSEDFKMLFAFKAACAQLPYFSYVKHVDLRMLAKEMASLELPTVDRWKTVEKYGKIKYRLHG